MDPGTVRPIRGAVDAAESSSPPSTRATSAASRWRSGGNRQARRHLTIGNRRDWHGGLGRQRARAGLRAIGLQKKRHYRCVRVRGETVRVFRWHRLTDARKQLPGCVRTPGLHECAACEWRRFTTAGKCPAVTCGAALRVRCLAGSRLLVCVVAPCCARVAADHPPMIPAIASMASATPYRVFDMDVCQPLRKPASIQTATCASR